MPGSFSPFATETENASIARPTPSSALLAKKEKLQRPPRYAYCQKLAEFAAERSVPVIVNGNIKDSASAAYAVQSVPLASGLMISRAAIQKPWIFYQLARDLPYFADSKLAHKEIPSSVKVDMQKISHEYINDVELYQPKEFWKTRLQRFFFYFSDFLKR